MFAPGFETPEGLSVVFDSAVRVRFPANVCPDEQAQGVSGIRFHGSVGVTEGFCMLAGPGKDRGTVSVDDGSAAPAPCREAGRRAEVPKGFGEALEPGVRLANLETTPDTEAAPGPATPPEDGAGQHQALGRVGFGGSNRILIGTRDL